MAHAGWSATARGLLAALLLAIAGGGRAAEDAMLWVHAGPGPERQVYEASIEAFHASQREVRVQLVSLPEGSHAEQVRQAAEQHRLPRLLDLDGPHVSYYGSLDEFEAVLQKLKARGVAWPLDMKLNYGIGERLTGKLRLYVDQIVEGTARVHPPTPAYPVITQAFSNAVARILRGADAQRELDAAAQAIDAEIERRQGYPQRPALPS